MEIESKIREYISSNILFSDDGYPYPDDASFLREGIVDSVGVLELVSFIEEQMKVKVLDQEITPDNFDSVHKLAAFVRSKQAV